MVVGNGLIASYFSSYINDDNIIIFASGVSNSNENRKYEFDREVNLIKKFNISDKKFIYFSTCSIFDNSLENSAYTNHKKNIESLIKTEFNKYIIIRLPNVVGNTINKNTSFNFFKNKIIKNEKITCKKNAYRYFIDIDDIINFSPFFINSEQYNKNIINMSFNNKENIYFFLLKMYDFLGKKPNIDLIDGGSNYNIDNMIFLNEISKLGYKIDMDYNTKLIKKYLK